MLKSGLVVQNRAREVLYPPDIVSKEKFIRPHVDGFDTGILKVSEPFEATPDINISTVNYKKIFADKSSPDEIFYAINRGNALTKGLKTLKSRARKDTVYPVPEKMRELLSQEEIANLEKANIKSNPFASYLFMKSGLADVQGFNEQIYKETLANRGGVRGPYREDEIVSASSTRPSGSSTSSSSVSPSKMSIDDVGISDSVSMAGTQSPTGLSDLMGGVRLPASDSMDVASSRSSSVVVDNSKDVEKFLNVDAMPDLGTVVDNMIYTPAALEVPQDIEIPANVDAPSDIPEHVPIPDAYDPFVTELKQVLANRKTKKRPPANRITKKRPPVTPKPSGRFFDDELRETLASRREVLDVVMEEDPSFKRKRSIGDDVDFSGKKIKEDPSGKRKRSIGDDVDFSGKKIKGSFQ